MWLIRPLSKIKLWYFPHFVFIEPVGDAERYHWRRANSTRVPDCFIHSISVLTSRRTRRRWGPQPRKKKKRDGAKKKVVQWNRIPITAVVFTPHWSCVFPPNVRSTESCSHLRAMNAGRAGEDLPTPLMQQWGIYGWCLLKSDEIIPPRAWASSPSPNHPLYSVNARTWGR